MYLKIPKKRKCMPKKWLLIDCSFICHKMKHTMGDLSYEEKLTGVIFGFFQYIYSLQKFHNTRYVIFCWDSKKSKRQSIYPKYKQKRIDHQNKMTDKEKRFEKEFRQQIKNLRLHYLPAIGFKNSFIQKGYEADDVMASICHSIKKDRAKHAHDEIILITSDHDMYQLLSSDVSLHDTNKPLTHQGFKKKYNIHPYRWIDVKAIAGCSSDNIKGIPGVGEKTAIKYLTGNLPNTHKTYQRIESAQGQRVIQRNLKLVELPFEGIHEFSLKKDCMSKEGWTKIKNKLGIKSLPNLFMEKRRRLA